MGSLSFHPVLWILWPSSVALLGRASFVQFAVFCVAEGATINVAGAVFFVAGGATINVASAVVGFVWFFGDFCILALAVFQLVQLQH